MSQTLYYIKEEDVIVSYEIEEDVLPPTDWLGASLRFPLFSHA
jgi:hypothetical protein